MRNWLHIVHRALVDTWDIVVGQPLHAVIVAVIIFSLTVYFARLYRGNDFARDIHIDGNQVTLRDLAPAGKMSTTLDFQPDDSGTFKTALIVNFQSEIRGTNMNYKAEFDFDVDKDFLKAGTFNYDHSQLDRIGISDLGEQVNAAFNSPQGIAAFNAPFYRPGTLIPNTVLFGNSNRWFYFQGGPNGRVGVVFFGIYYRH